MATTGGNGNGGAPVGAPDETPTVLMPAIGDTQRLDGLAALVSAMDGAASADGDAAGQRTSTMPAAPRSSAGSSSHAEPPLPPMVPPPDDGPAGPGPDAGRVAGIIGNVLLALALVAAVCAGGYYGYFGWRAHDHESALSACRDAQGPLDDSQARLAKSLAAAKAASQTSPGDIDDPSEIAYITTLMGNDPSKGLGATDCPAGADAATLRTNTGNAERVAGNRSSLADKLDASVKAITESRTTKQLDDAWDSLAQHRTEAVELIAEAKGNVADDSTITALTRQSDAVATYLDAGRKDRTQADVQQRDDALTAAMEAVRSSMTAKKDADDKAKRDADARGACTAATGRYGMLQGSMTITLSTDCSATIAPNDGTPPYTLTYKPGSYDATGDGGYELELSDGSTIRYYPVGVESPAAKERYKDLGVEDTSINKQKMERNDTPFIR